jgi:hypothetical protein
VLLGVLRWRTGSIVPGMTMHAINNALIGTLAQRPALAAWVGLDAATGGLAWLPVFAGTAVMAAALAGLWATTSPAVETAGITPPAPAVRVPTPL